MSSSPQPASEGYARTFWRRRILNPIVAQLTQGITPEKVALTIAAGSAIAVSPAIGLTTVLCLVAGIVLRLNQPAIQTVNLLCVPIHLPLIYVWVRGGEWLFHRPPVPGGMKHYAELLASDPWRLVEESTGTFLHATVAWALVAPVWTGLVFYISRPVLRNIVRIRAESAMKHPSEGPPVHPVP